jgi:tRNA-binding EMAP/Myf-like protein
MLSITEQSNYLARVVRLENPKKHPNADRLQIWNINGYDVITDMSRKEGDICIYFPIECQIDSTILSKLNLYSDKELNEDKNIAGYVHKTGRVRAVKLRDIMSEGMILPADQISNTINQYYNWKDVVNEEFDTIWGTTICKKYVPIVKEVRSGGGTGEKKGPKINDILIPNQFNFHYSTSKLQDNIYKFENEEDVIVITDKWHGTSFVASNVLTKRKLSWWEKTRKFMGAKIKTQEYSKMYSSRTVIKSIEGKYHTPEGGYYNSDIWGKVFGEIKDKLPKGYSIYGEIVGYVGEKLIQKDYDYGCKPGEHKLLIYRITKTTFLGSVIECSWDEIKDFCKEHNLEHVPELFHGTVKDWKLKYADDGETFLDALKGVYLEKDCFYCIKKVPAEGICIRNESEYRIAYKLKSRAFLLKETAELDKGEEVVE